MKVFGHPFETPFGDAVVMLATYLRADGPMAVFLVDSEAGDRIGVLSVNLPESAELAEGEFCAKTWSENEPLVRPALASGLFEDTGRRVHAGFVEAQVWRLVGEVLA